MQDYAEVIFCNASLAERAQRVQRKKLRLTSKTLTSGSIKTKSSPLRSSDASVKLQPLHAQQQRPPVADWYHPCNANPLNFIPPPLSSAIRGLGLPLERGTPTLPAPIRSAPLLNCGSTAEQLSTIEDLLEWQWEQGGTLLMQQAENTDG